MGLSKYKVVGVIQCRTGSKRLPNKALMKLGKRSMIQCYIERCKLIEGIDELVLATTELTKDDILCDIAKIEGIKWFRGSENDLIDRIYSCAKEYKADLVVRLCADNPLIEPEEVDNLIKSFGHREYLYSNAGDFDNIADGLGAELYHIDALRWADINSKEREHPHKIFGVMNLVITVPLKEDYPRVKLDVNNIDEYEFVSKIYDNYGKMPYVKDYIGDL